MLDRERFESLADALDSISPPGSRLVLGIRAEDSSFARFNRARVRQFSQVAQVEAQLTLESGQRQTSASLTLSADVDRDLATLRETARMLHERAEALEPDPHLAVAAPPCRSSRDEIAEAMTDPAAEAARVADLAGDDDFVGFLAAGPVARAVADNHGLRHWHRVASSHLDFSLQAAPGAPTPNAAVKSIVAGRCWDARAFERSLERTREQLLLASQPARAIDPGSYRVYLGPMAVAELLSCMAWSGFSRRDRDTGTSSLSLLTEQERSLCPAFSLSESPSLGLAPAFTADGHTREESLALIDAGRPVGELVSPRSGAEFGLAINADGHETPGSLNMAPGALAPDDALAALDDGLWIENLWYLNYSDRRAARVTGMSRFASFVVERGRIVAPLAPMRFDDSLLSLFGDAFEAASAETTLLPDGDTWGARSLNSCRCPGLLVSAMRFAL